MLVPSTQSRMKEPVPAEPLAIKAAWSTPAERRRLRSSSCKPITSTSSIAMTSAMRSSERRPSRPGNYAHCRLRPAGVRHLFRPLAEAGLHLRAQDQPRRPPDFFFQGRRCQSYNVTRRERLLSSSKICVCCAANSSSSTFRFASSFNRSERLSKFAEPTDDQQSSTIRYCSGSAPAWNRKNERLLSAAPANASSRPTALPSRQCRDRG